MDSDEEAVPPVEVEAMDLDEEVVEPMEAAPESVPKKRRGRRAPKKATVVEDPVEVPAAAAVPAVLEGGLVIVDGSHGLELLEDAAVPTVEESSPFLPSHHYNP